jgi:monoamine oxidase
MQLYGIVGGNEQLISALAASINADVRLESKVRRIRKTPTQKMEIEVEVRCSNAAITVQRHAYDYLVLALPLDHSKKIDFGGSVLSEAIKQHFQHFDHPAHYLRISILFERPFWNGILADSFCMLEAFGGCCLYDESSRCPESKWGVLGWLLGGDAALQMAELTDQELLEAALGSLPDELAFGRRLLVEGKVHRWIGAVNAMPGGQHILPLDCRHVPEPQFHSNFFVVGDYLFDSTVNGVLESANYVSDWISSTVNG